MSKIAVLIPCHNEATTIAELVSELKTCLPHADIFVYDNNSTDDTLNEARKAGAIVGSESRQGKGHVVRQMCRDIDADIYVMIDGDGTYDASSAKMLIDTFIERRVDMLTASRMDTYRHSNSRSGHLFGNQLITYVFNQLFQQNQRDILSGYRVMSKRFIKTLNLPTGGFEVESIMNIHAQELLCPTLEVDILYKARPDGSTSKLRTIRDGLRILLTIFYLLKEARPFLFFSSIAAMLILISLIIGSPVIIEFITTGYVSKLPSAVLAASIGILAAISLTIGIILDSVAHTRKELKRLLFMQIK